jgi:hypothetical protein
MNIKPYLVPIIVTAGATLFIAWSNSVIPGGVGAGPMLIPVLVGATMFRLARIKSRLPNQPVASGEARAAALAFPAQPGMGAIVVWRRAKSIKMAGFDVTLDGALAAQLLVSQFVVLPVAIGTHRLFADIGDARGNSAVEPREVEVAENDMLFFETRTSMGVLRASVHLDPLADTPELRARLGKAAMVVPVGPSA